ncbi:MAG: type IV pilus modification PilV family protein [bacterium]
MRFSQNNEGFTLIEIMVALVLALIIFFSFSRVFIFGLQSEGYINNKLQAKNVANSIVEYIRENRDLLENKNDIEWQDVEEAFDNGVKFIDDPDENINIDHEDNSDENIYEVAIKIEWQERGNDRSYSLNSLLSGD